ncbi:DUF1513 domain-containing protein [Pusillimonas sp.]|uniref:DUF1513 domain-containing protein n=1 Tax=Pusillimonas sp. TaxID=3040095 RepID=UPI0037C8C627
MHLTEIDRRRFLAFVLASGAVPLCGAAQTPPSTSQALYLAARKREGQYEAAVFDAAGTDLRVVPLPDRGHSFAIDKERRRAVAFGRQPGFFAMAFDLEGGEPARPLPIAKGRHYFGHGVYTPDGRLLFATENDYEAGRGLLGIYDASALGGYRRVGEFSSAGIGPHEVVLMPDGHTLCVANGGILTHPDYGKLELNLDSMKPSLAYVDARSGKLLEQVYLPDELHQLSLRHMALDATGAVWVGCQYMGPAAVRPALVARHRRGEPIRLFPGPPEVLRGMRNYVGSVAADPGGRFIATSSPVGNCVVFWEAVSGSFLGQVRLNDGCGVAAAADNGFLLSNGLGALVSIGLAHESHTMVDTADLALEGERLTTILSEQPGRAWDNHLRKV